MSISARISAPESKLPGTGTTIFTVMSQLAEQHGAVNLSQGFPDFDPPARLIDLGRRTATERIVRLILEIEERARMRGLVSDQTIPFPLRQTHIADALGLTAVHVNRTINALRREGHITFRRGSMVIENRKALQEIAGF